MKNSADRQTGAIESDWLREALSWIVPVPFFVGDGAAREIAYQKHCVEAA